MSTPPIHSTGVWPSFTFTWPPESELAVAFSEVKSADSHQFVTVKHTHTQYTHIVFFLSAYGHKLHRLNILCFYSHYFFFCFFCLTALSFFCRGMNKLCERLYYRATHMRSADYAVARCLCPSVCQSVCLSHAGVLSKRLNISSVVFTVG